MSNSLLCLALAGLLILSLATSGEAKLNLKLKQKDKADKCKDGEYVDDSTSDCVQCTIQFCEVCESSQICSKCMPGYYRVIEKKEQIFCSPNFPRGYIPDLKNFKKNNPELLQSVSTEQIQFAVAANGKSIITDEKLLPFEKTEEGPRFQDQKIRVDLIPCKKQCKECPEGYLLNKDRKCIPPEKCRFPQQIVESQCIDPEQDDFHVKIDRHEKVNKKSQSEITVEVLTSRDKDRAETVEFEWSVDVQENFENGTVTHYPEESSAFLQKIDSSAKRLRFDKYLLPVNKLVVLNCQVTWNNQTIVVSETIPNYPSEEELEVRLRQQQILKDKLEAEENKKKEREEKQNQKKQKKQQKQQEKNQDKETSKEQNAEKQEPDL